MSKVAKRAKLSRPWFSRMLNGKSAPTLPVCDRIAGALDTSLEALIAQPPVSELENFKKFHEMTPHSA